MNTSLKQTVSAQSAVELHSFNIIIDENGAPVLPESNSEALISEAMIPQVRTVATLIAAERHDFKQSSPDHFTDAADFFAARILVLGVRRFHLDVSMNHILTTANRRAQQFAAKHHLFFAPAQAQFSLNKHKNTRLLTVETEHEIRNQGNPVANSIEFAKKLPVFAL